MVCVLEAVTRGGRLPAPRNALRWMDKLCDNAGIAEDLGWVLRRAVFARTALRSEIAHGPNQSRRQPIKIDRFADLPADFIEWHRSHILEVDHKCVPGT